MKKFFTNSISHLAGIPSPETRANRSRATQGEQSTFPVSLLLSRNANMHGSFTPTELEAAVQTCVAALSSSGAMDRVRLAVEQHLKPCEQMQQNAISQRAVQFLEARPNSSQMVAKPVVLFAETQAAVLGSEVTNTLQNQIDDISLSGRAKWLRDIFQAEILRLRNSHPDLNVPCDSPPVKQECPLPAKSNETARLDVNAGSSDSPQKPALAPKVPEESAAETPPRKQDHRPDTNVSKLASGTVSSSVRSHPSSPTKSLKPVERASSPVREHPAPPVKADAEDVTKRPAVELEEDPKRPAATDGSRAPLPHVPDTSETSVRSVQNISPVRSASGPSHTEVAGEESGQKSSPVPQTCAQDALAATGDSSMSHKLVDKSESGKAPVESCDPSANMTKPEVEQDVVKERDATPVASDHVADTVRSQSSARSGDGRLDREKRKPAEDDAQAAAPKKKKRRKRTKEEKKERKRLKKEAKAKERDIRRKRKAAERDSAKDVPNAGDVSDTECQDETANNNEESQPLEQENTHPEDYVAQQNVLKCLRKLMEQEFAIPFLQPVDPEWQGCETYLEEIENPMDLGTVAKRLQNSTETSGFYRNVDAVMSDVNLIWTNCKQYNGELDPVSCAATKCVSYLDIALESMEKSEGDSGRIRRRNSSRGTGPKREKEQSGTQISKRRKRLEAKDVAEAKPIDTVNDGRFLGKRLLIFAAVLGPVKDWLKADVTDFDATTLSYTLKFRGVDHIDPNATFGDQEVMGKTPKYPIFKVTGN